jgi:hypothetical protein
VDAAVRNQPLQRQPGYLAPYGIETGKDDRLRGIVDDEVDAGQGLKGPDVAALAANDAALHLVVGEFHNRHGVLRHVIRGALLYGEADDAPRPRLRLFASWPPPNP